jgi:hypothetical protein
MISLQSRAIPQSTDCSFPKDIFLLKKFKSLVNQQVQLLGIAKRFRPRLYSHADFIMVKLYAMVRQISVHVAAEGLNAYITEHYFTKYNLKPKTFCDKMRKRRFMPHQTDVDKYFRRFSEEEVQNLFGNINMALCRQIAQHFGELQQWRFLVDNTEYPYYGKTSTAYEQKTFKHHMGTKTIRLFQGHSVHCQNITLFTDFYLLQKGKCRWLSIPHSTDWLKWNEFNLKYGLMDREFYRTQLIKKLKDRKIPIIIPSKKYSRVKRTITDFLLKKGPLRSKYLLKQTSGAKPWPSSVWVHIVVVGHNDQSPWKIRKQLWNGTLTFDEAKKSLSAFFTTLIPWKNERAWVRWLTKTYKIRWNQETGFSSLNKIHEQFRYRSPVVQLAELYLRSMIHNGWQFYRNQGLKVGIHHQELTLFWYRMRIIDRIEEELISSTHYNVKYLQKEKRRLYFED